MEYVFDFDEEGFSLFRIVVFQGCAGIGKIVVVYKFMFDWVAGTVILGRFDYFIYVNCREISYIVNFSVVDLIINIF